MLQSLPLNEAYYHQCLSGIIEAHLPEIADRHAAALLGWGSEVLGNDDEYSKVYGWGPRLVLFLPEEDYPTQAARVKRLLHEQVPLRFKGFPTRFTDPEKGPPQPVEDPNGHLQIPITTCRRFFRLYLGLAAAEYNSIPLTPRCWLTIPEAGLLRLTSGAVYFDGTGELERLRRYFRYFPDDVWRFRLAYQWRLLDWDIDLVGLCAQRGDMLSARLAVARSVERIIGIVFLLNRVYRPGYLKWLHRQFYKLPMLSPQVGPILESVLGSRNPGSAVNDFYDIVDLIVMAQVDIAGVEPPAYQQPAGTGRGFFAYDLNLIVEAVRATVTGELSQLGFKTGAVDQWLLDQDLLMNPEQLTVLDGVFDLDDPVKALFTRSEFEHFL